MLGRGIEGRRRWEMMGERWERLRGSNLRRSGGVGASACKSGLSKSHHFSIRSHSCHGCFRTLSTPFSLSVLLLFAPAPSSLPLHLRSRSFSRPAAPPHSRIHLACTTLHSLLATSPLAALPAASEPSVQPQPCPPTFLYTPCAHS